MTGDAAQVLKAVAQDQSGLRRQVDIMLGGAPRPLSGASSPVGIHVPFVYDPCYCYTCKGGQDTQWRIHDSPDRGCQPQRRRRQLNILANFPQKLHENKEN